MKRKSSITSQGGARFLTHKGFAGITSLLMLLLLWTSGYSQNYPFPQSFKYSFGQLPEIDPAVMAQKVQSQFSTWDQEYYEEKVIDGTTYGRIKFSQVGEDGSATVSEGIAYGMLIYVYMENSTNNCRDKFDALWNYYDRYKNSNKVMNWKIDGFGDPSSAVIDPNGATDAEIDVATALLLAYKQWDDESYLDKANQLLNTIWTYEIEQSTKTILPGDAFDQVLNPCYFTTNGIQLFQEVTEKLPGKLPPLDWDAVVAKSYEIMKKAANSSTGLIPDWVLNQPPNYPYITGVLPFDKSTPPKFTSDYKYDAVRIPWRMAHAYAWYGHKDAQDIAAAITDWAIGKYGTSGAGNMVDGYKVDGTELGVSSNACFTGGFAVGGMVANQGETDKLTFLTSGFNQTDLGENGSYFNHTTQLLYMMLMSGNMPNFYSMSPTILSAKILEVPEDKDNVMIVTMSQEIDESTVTADGWVIKTDENTLPVGIKSVTTLNSKQIKFILDGTVVDAGTYIAYDGSGDLEKLEGGTAVPEIEAFRVLNEYPYKRPAILSLSSVPDGTEVIMMLDKVLWDEAVASSAENFTITAGSKTLTLSALTMDANDPKILHLLIDGSEMVANRIQEGDDVTLTFDGEFLMTENWAKVKPFTDKPVENLTVTVECDIIADAESSSLGEWDSAPVDADDEFAAFESNPSKDDDNSSLNVIHFAHESTSSEWSAPKFKFTSTDYPTVNSLLEAGQYVLNFKLYAPNSSDIGKQLMFMFFNSDDDDDNGSYSQAGHNFKGRYNISTIGEWVDVEIDLGLYANSSITADMFEVSIERGVEGGSGEIYIDDLKFCTPQPSAQIAKAITSFNGDKIKATFKTAMAAPSDVTGFEVSISQGLSTTVAAVVSAELDPTDSKTLILSLDNYVTKDDEVYITYAGDAVKTVDGRFLESFKNVQVINAYGRAITKGWRDDFDDCSAGDYITQNIGGTNAEYGALGASGETCDGPNAETYEIVGKGSKAYEPWGVFLKDAIMDLSKNPFVEVKFTCSETLYLRCDLKDLINDRNTDQMPVKEFEAGTHTVKFEFEGVKLLNEYDADGNVGEVDITSIYQVLFYTWSEAPDASNTYTPTVSSSKVYFDYISIGASVSVSDVPTQVAQGESFDPKSSADGSIFVISTKKVQDLTGSSTIDRDPAILQYYVSEGCGVEVACTADQNVTIETDGMSGYYNVMSYDPVTSAVSFPKGVSVNDETLPILTSVTDGDKIYGGQVSATANEDARFYLVDATKIKDYIANSGYIARQAVNAESAPSALAEEAVTIDLTADYGVKMGGKYLLVAIDGSGNVSLPSDTIFIKTIGTPYITIAEPAPYNVGDVITVTVDRDCDFIIYETESGNLTNMVGQEVQNVEGNVAVQIELKEYYNVFGPVYNGFKDQTQYTIQATDGSGEVGELGLFIGEAVNELTSITVPSTLTVYEGASSELSIIKVPSNANNVDVAGITVEASNSNVTITKVDDFTYTIEGATEGSVDVDVTVPTTGSDSFTKTIAVTVKASVNEDEIPASLDITPALSFDLDINSDQTIGVEVLNSKGASAGVSQDVNIVITSGEEFISLDGKTVTGVAEGEAVITVTSLSVSSVTEEIKITVNKVPVESVDLTITDLTLKIGAESAAPVKATVVPADATNSEISTSIDDETIISLDASGFVTALAEGTAVITYTADGVEAKCTVTVEKYIPTEISVTPQTFLQSEFISAQVDYTLTADGTTNAEYIADEVEFASDDESVISINSTTGLMTPGGSTGTATITVTSVADKSVVGTAVMTVTASENNVASVSLDVETLDLNIGDTYTFEATLVGEDPNEAVSNSNVTYTVDKPSIVSITSASGGVIKALEKGEATITVTTENGSKTATCVVTVSAIEITSITIDSETSLTLNKGEGTQVEYSIAPAEANDDVVIKPAEETGVISVSESGYIEALAAGTAEVLVYSVANPDDVVETITVTVEVPAEGISFTQTSLKLAVDKSTDLAGLVEIDPVDATQTDLEWEVTGDATITSAGELTAGSVTGDVTVTVTVAGTDITATLPVEIISDNVDVPVTDVKFSESSVSVAEDGTITVTVATNNDATDKSLDFELSKTGVAEYSESYSEATGKYTVEITGLAEGTVLLTASSGNVSDNLSIEVTSAEVRVTSIEIQDKLTVASEGTAQISVVATTPSSGYDPIDWVYSIKSGSKYASIDASTGELTAEKVSADQTVEVVAKAIYSDETIESNVCTVTIAYEVESVTSFEINQSNSDLDNKETGDKGTLTYTSTPEGAVAETVKYTSNSDLVSINETTGAWEVLAQPAYGKGDLEVTLTLEIDDLPAETVTLTVLEEAQQADVPVESITIQKYTLDVAEGQSIELLSSFVTVAPSKATNKAITWEIVGTANAEINGTTLTAKSGKSYVDETFEIIAVAADGGGVESDPIVVTITSIPVTGFTLSYDISGLEEVPQEVELDEGDKKQIYVSKILPNDATYGYSDSEFSSDKPTVVSISGHKIVAESEGTATITIELDGVTKTFDVTVTGVQVVLDYVELESLVKQAKDKVMSKYTKELYDAYKTANAVLSEAKTGDTTQDAIKEQVDILKALLDDGVAINPSVEAGLYPLPFSVELTVEAKSITSIEVYTLSGALVLAQDVNKADKVVVKTAELAKGAYYVKVITENGTAVVKATK